MEVSVFTTDFSVILGSRPKLVYKKLISARCTGESRFPDVFVAGEFFCTLGNTLTHFMTAIFVPLGPAAVGCIRQPSEGGNIVQIKMILVPVCVSFRPYKENPQPALATLTA